MPTQSRSTLRARIPSLALVAFVGITFLITWGLIGVYILFPDTAAAWFGEISGSHPFFFLATWSPAISAFVIVFLYAGTSGIRAFLSRLFLWRCSAGWAAFILVGLPLVFVVGSLLKGGPMLAPLPPEGIGSVVAILFMMLFLGPIEEFGWRGMAQPMLQRQMAPVWVRNPTASMDSRAPSASLCVGANGVDITRVGRIGQALEPGADGGRVEPTPMHQLTAFAQRRIVAIAAEPLAFSQRL